MNKFFDIKNIISDDTEFVGRLHSHTDGIISFKATYEITLANASVVTKDYTEITGYSNGQISFDLDHDILSVKAIEKVSPPAGGSDPIEELAQYVTMAINSADTVNVEAYILATTMLKKRDDFPDNGQTFDRHNKLIPTILFPDDTGKPDIIEPIIPLAKLSTKLAPKDGRGLLDAVIELGRQGSFQDEFTARIVPLWAKVLFEQGWSSFQILTEINLTKFWYVSGTVEPIEVQFFELIYFEGKVYLHWWTSAKFRQVNIPAIPIIAKEITKTTQLKSTHGLHYISRNEDGTYSFSDSHSPKNFNIVIDRQHAADLVNAKHLRLTAKMTNKELSKEFVFDKNKGYALKIPFQGTGRVRYRVILESEMQGVMLDTDMHVVSGYQDYSIPTEVYMKATNTFYISPDDPDTYTLKFYAYNESRDDVTTVENHGVFDTDDHSDYKGDFHLDMHGEVISVEQAEFIELQRKFNILSADHDNKNMEILALQSEINNIKRHIGMVK